MLRLGSIVIRVDDIQAQARFWTQALDYVARDPAATDFVVLRPRTGSGPNVSLDAVPSERVLPPRIHLDLYADDQAAEVRRLTDLGARSVHWDRRPGREPSRIVRAPSRITPSSTGFAGTDWVRVPDRAWAYVSARGGDAASPAARALRRGLAHVGEAAIL